MAPPKRGGTRLMTALLLIYRPQKDERLSWSSWLTCSGRFTHIVVTRRLQDERRTGSVRRPETGVLTTLLCNQPRLPWGDKCFIWSRALYVILRVRHATTRGRVFAACATSACNSISDSTRSPPSLNTFRTHLKTKLFQRSFKS